MRIYFPTGGYVIIDSGFYVLKGLIELMKKVGFAYAVIKKRRYWLSTVPGKEMKDNFGDGEGGLTDAKHGTIDYVV